MKNTKGISLIVLVVTIIVMIIIAGAIIISLSNTDVIDQAETAVQKHNESSEKDILTLAWGEYMAASVNNPAANLQVQGATVTKEATDGWMVTFTSGNTYLVSSKGQITPNGKQEELVVDDEKVAELVEEWLLDFQLSAERMAELKKEVYMENMPGEELTDIAIYAYDENYEYEFAYFEKVDRLYIIEEEEIGKDVIHTVYYASRQEVPNTYAYAKKLIQIQKELNTVFVGKTEAEIEQKYNDKTLEKYILDNCQSIRSVKQYEDYWSADGMLGEISFEFNGKKYEEFFDYNVIFFNLDDDGKYINVYYEPH